MFVHPCFRWKGRKNGLFSTIKFFTFSVTTIPWGKARRKANFFVIPQKPFLMDKENIFFLDEDLDSWGFQIYINAYWYIELRIIDLLMKIHKSEYFDQILLVEVWPENPQNEDFHRSKPSGVYNCKCSFIHNWKARISSSLPRISSSLMSWFSNVTRLFG